MNVINNLYCYMKRVLKIVFWVMCVFFVLGMVMPQNLQMPVDGASSGDYNHQTFWYPWGGRARVHKGVDIFARRGTKIHSATMGVVVSTGYLSSGGNYVTVLGPKWRIYYYAHLNEILVKEGDFVSHNSLIGTVGNTGSAAKTPSHLHFTIFTFVPYPWRIDTSTDGWKKMFYLNPIDYLND